MNPMDILKNFKNIQENMTQMQEKLKTVEVSGSSGGGMVQITMNGNMEILKVHIDKEAVDPDDVTMLEDLVLAAARDASAKLKETLQTEVAGLAGGMGFPPGMMGL